MKLSHKDVELLQSSRATSLHLHLNWGGKASLSDWISVANELNTRTGRELYARVVAVYGESHGHLNVHEALDYLGKIIDEELNV